MSHSHPSGSLRDLFSAIDSSRAATRVCVPPKTDVHTLAAELFNFLFPINCARDWSAEVRHGVLRAHLSALLKQTLESSQSHATSVADAFLLQLPGVYDHLLEDVSAALAFDPAAESGEEVVTSYPGFYAIAIYRLAHELHHLNVLLLPRMLTEYAHSVTGIDIHPAASIGRSFFIDHGTGIVVGATAVIGDNVKLYQGVTLGGLQVDKSLAGTKRHPTIEDNVIIYANATILGGQTVVGRDSIIGGNVFLTDSVPPMSLVYHRSQVSVRQKGGMAPQHTALDFVI
ncbi:MAG: serine O-acetyltransferase [Chloroflexi bacterium]|nr:serine O-acetyltransferase [Chloroflexota bacterium]